MSRVKVIAILLVVVLNSVNAIDLSAIEVPDWNYKNLGPAEWPYMLKYCKGIEQSPINIKGKETVYVEDLADIEFINYNYTMPFNLYNTGQSLVMKPEGISAGVFGRIMPAINGYGIDSLHELIQFHFHWGYSDHAGSEHQLNGEGMPLELHLVHANTDGHLAVLGVFFNYSDNNEPNQYLAPIIQALGPINSTEDPTKLNTTINEYNIRNLLDGLNALNNQGYYRYYGSLTTPPCAEHVTWSVFQKILKISRSQMRILRSKYPGNFFRPIQSLEGRKPYVNKCLAINDCDERTVEKVVTTPRPARNATATRKAATATEAGSDASQTQFTSNTKAFVLIASMVCGLHSSIFARKL